MSHYYKQELRVKGGPNFVGAMFRFSASPREYSRRLGQNRINKMALSESVKIYDSEEYFIISIHDEPKIIKDYYFVESKRQEAVYAFENWLEQTVLELLQA